MKQTFALVILFAIIHCASAQYGCILQAGDSCRLIPEVAEFRTSPNYNYRISGTIDPQSSPAEVVILQSKVINGYVKIKVVRLLGDTSGIGHLLNKEAWVKKKYLDCVFNFVNHDFGDSSMAWNEDIARAENFKKNKLCKYSASQHARLLLDRARAKYHEEDFQGSVDDISHAMDLLPYSDNLIIYHWYRAHAMTELGDIEGAIADFDYIIGHKDSLNAGSYDFDLNEVLCWKAQNLYLAGENFKAKSILNIVIVSDPENGFAYYLRGLVRYYFEDKPGGCEDLVKASELGFEKAFEDILEKCQ